ncbi:S49 family peptidase [Psychromonas sp. 14N.309.X.WAT.B.A12]|uniref:S49 family peptidase n=1 Tax=Psychromonas sp. 14N.309.X.WAT.B.A12 TaxID=2998322 RepID=UPI0025B1B3B8|nr:S49 family peptidase [Psychromonas sp. 14N.309.X.WAT.B.A12]MDN2661873.1 S49 family peptidase [Psychromonas sp. 14N.309.X.WAT.B.A12]
MQEPESHQEKWLSGFMKETFKEQKRTRRWGVFFKLLTFTYLFVGLFLFMNTGLLDKDTSSQEKHTAMVVVNGVIAADEEANANSIVSSLRAAFKNEYSKAVMMVINSPGGSPVQAGYVNDEIKRLRGLYPEKKLYAVIAELGASGGYYMAVAADEIYADKASLVGSIGVTASGFGFVDLMEKVGVERRHYTSGEHKAFLDPFSPAKKDEGEFWQSVLDSTHQQFIKVVEEGRGDRLLKDNEDLYSGLIWNGEQALAMGLIDGLGSPGYVAREVIQAEDIVDYSIKPSPLESFTEQLGLSIGEGVATLLNSSNASMELR